MRVAELRGLWRRSVIMWPGGACDGTTRVAWLQGPSRYADLRQPSGLPACAAGTLRDLARPALDGMCRQEGFAGTLRAAAGVFHWERAIDFRPPAATPDAGTLRREAGRLVEEGCHMPYVEHWRPVCAAAAPCGALALASPSEGRRSLLVRVGRCFMLARDRRAVLPCGATLEACVAGAASLRAAQDMLDCEISLGRIGRGGWRICRSTLPFLAGSRLDIGWAPGCGHRVLRRMPDADGAWARVAYEVEAAEGDAGALLAPCA